MSPQTKIEDTGSSSALTQLAGHLFASQCLSIPLAQCIRHKLRDAWARSGTSPQSSPDLIAKCQPQKQRLPCTPLLSLLHGLLPFCLSTSKSDLPWGSIPSAFSSPLHPLCLGDFICPWLHLCLHTDNFQTFL